MVVRIEANLLRSKDGDHVRGVTKTGVTICRVHLVCIFGAYVVFSLFSSFFLVRTLGQETNKSFGGRRNTVFTNASSQACPLPTHHSTSTEPLPSFFFLFSPAVPLVVHSGLNNLTCRRLAKYALVIQTNIKEYGVDGTCAMAEHSWEASVERRFSGCGI